MTKVGAVPGGLKTAQIRADNVLVTLSPGIAVAGNQPPGPHQAWDLMNGRTSGSQRASRSPPASSHQADHTELTLRHIHSAASTIPWSTLASHSTKRRTGWPLQSGSGLASAPLLPPKYHSHLDLMHHPPSELGELVRRPEKEEPHAGVEALVRDPCTCQVVHDLHDEAAQR